MIRVLHIFGQMVRHGAEVRTIELMPAMAEKDTRFDFCTLLQEEGQLDARIRDLGGEVFTCPLKADIWSFARRFLSLLEQFDYDIVHCHSHYFSGYILRLAHKAGIKGRIAHFRSMGDGKRVTLKRKLYHYAMRRMIDKHATAILAVGRGAMECSWRRDWQKDRRCRVIHNGFDLSVFDQTVADRNGVRSELGIAEDSRLVIYVARFIQEKAHDVLLDAAAAVMSENQRVHLLLVGDGDLRQAMEAKARDLQIEQRVHFPGLRSDVPRLLKASDCFVSPSLREGLPGVVLEAVAANLSVIATDLPGVREIAEYTDLVSIVPLENSDALAAAITKTMKDIESHPPKERPFPHEFDLDHCAAQLFEVYSSQVG